MRRTFLLAGCLLAAAVPLRPAPAQEGAANPAGVLADSVQRLATAAFYRGDAEGVRAARMLADRALTVHRNDPLLLHHKGYALYREALLQVINTPRGGQPSAADQRALRDLLTTAQRTLEQSAAARPLPETYALLSAVAGQQAGAARGMGSMRAGMRASSEMERAVELGPENPRVWMLRGTNAFYTPSMWGGGEDRALEFLQRAVRFFERDAARAPLPTWGHAEAYAWIGVIHMRRRDPARAREAYEHALRIEPTYGWVREVLLPRAQQASR